MKLIGKNKEILFLFLAALTLRFFLVFTACGIANDGCSYLWLAEAIATGDFDKIFSSILPPLFPIFIAGGSYIFQDFEITNWRLLAEEQKQDFDIAFIEGAATTPEHIKLLKWTPFISGYEF